LIFLRVVSPVWYCPLYDAPIITSRTALELRNLFAEACVGDIGCNAVDNFCCSGKCIARRGHIA
jgi:hypothetical protein